jgi:hypothetical protein
MVSFYLVIEEIKFKKITFYTCFCRSVKLLSGGTGNYQKFFRDTL